MLSGALAFIRLSLQVAQEQQVNPSFLFAALGADVAATLAPHFAIAMVLATACPSSRDQNEHHNQDHNWLPYSTVDSHLT